MKKISFAAGLFVLIMSAFVLQSNGWDATLKPDADSPGSAGLVWNTFLGAPGYGNDHAKSICADRRGNIYIVGYCEGTWGSPVRPYGGG
jgi:hypothetical protein